MTAGRWLEWSTEKERLFRFEANVVVSAAAGSGKTTALVELYLRLLEGLPPAQGGPGGLGPGGRPLEPEEIVAVTFTEKAAQDLERKIREGLLARVDAARALEDPAARRVAIARWEEARARLEAAPVGTIHSYAARLLREHPVEAEVDPGFDVLDEVDAGALRREAIEAVAGEALRNRDPALVLLLGHLSLPDQGEQPGLESSLAAALARLRGAGTSVEEVRQATRARLVELDGEQARLAADIEAAVAALRGVAGAQPVLAAWDALPEATRHLGPKLDDAAWAALLALKPFLESWTGKGSRPRARTELETALKPLPLFFWQRVATPLGDAFLDLLGRADAAYAAARRRRHALDFDDLEECALRLLRRNLAAGGRLLAARPAAVLVDEFQDNNRRQLEIVTLLAGDGAGRLRERALVVVGDPKQSIYRFRGADVSVFRQIADLVMGDAGPLHAGPLRTEPLRFAENFRSAPGILEVVNGIFERYMGPPAPDRPAYEVPFGPGDVLVPKRDGVAGPAVEVISLPVNETREVGTLREMEAVVRRIGRLRTEGVRAGDVAVLMRTLKHAPLVQRGLEAAGIPAYVVKGGGFYGAPEILDLLCLLQSLDCPFDDLALAAVLRSPFAGISDDALLLLAHPDPAARPRPLHQAFRDARLAPPVPPLPEADCRRLQAFAAWHHELRARKDRTPMPELIEEALERTGYLEVCLTRAGGDQQVGNLRKLVEQARTFEARPGRTLRDFVRELERAVEEEPRETEAQVAGESEDVVRIMTIHAAKGLEFPVVVVPCCADQMPGDRGPVVLDEDPEAGGLALRPFDPSTLETQPTWLVKRLGEARRQKAKAEWQRLFYVVATRAKARLILVGEHAVNRDGSPRDVDTWRREVDALLTARPELEARGVVRRLRWEELAPLEDGRLADGRLADGGLANSGLANSRLADGRLADGRLADGGTADGGIAESGLAEGGLADSGLGEAPRVSAAPSSADGIGPIVQRLQWRPARPTWFAHSTTELAEFATCPQRYYLTRRLGLPDNGDPWFDSGDERAASDAWDGGESGPAQLRPVDRGRLAHAVLERAPLGLEGPVLASCVRELVRTHAAMVPGGVPDAEQAEIADRIVAFLHGPTGRALGRVWKANQDRVLREYPFVLRLADGGATLLLRGTIDALWLGDDGAWSLIDYKTTHQREPDPTLEYEFQLLTYALAASRLDGALVSQAGIVFLLDEPAEPAWIDASPARLAAFEARAVSHARQIADLEREARDGDGWPRIERAACERLRCRFIPRCHGPRG